MQERFRLNPTIKIQDRKIGKFEPVFIIAEIGINHDGELTTAKEMIDCAAACGVDCVKFQTFRTEEFLSDRTMIHNYIVNGNKVSENMFTMFKRLELPVDWHDELFSYARDRNLIFLTSVADKQSADIVEDLGIQAFKLSSEDFINLPLVKHVVKKHKPIIFSTGMADATEIEDVLKVLKRNQFNQAVFLHCVSLYPTLPEEAHLKRISYLSKKVKGPVGYSDHTMGIDACMGAVALGACIIEKHFTLDRHRNGPDHFFSADPDEMKRLVESIRKMEKMIGESTADQSIREMSMRKIYRRSIVAARDLDIGQTLNKEDVFLKRPGNGLQAREMPLLIGKRLKTSLKKDEPITLDRLE